VTTTRRKPTTTTTAPPAVCRVRCDDDYPLEHWLAVKRSAFPPGTPPEEQLRHHRWVEERIAVARLRGRQETGR
jgi:hypothetical protein